MQSRTILLSVLFSAIILSVSHINIDSYNLPFKATFDSLDEETQKQVTCLADNMYFEAASERIEGQKAVAFVTINRLLSGNYANDICGVVYQKINGTCQFSWLCENKSTKNRLAIRETLLYNNIRDLAINMMVNFKQFKDNTGGATFYHADYVKPGWKLEKVEKIGRHIFYRNQKDEIDRNRGII